METENSPSTRTFIFSFIFVFIFGVVGWFGENMGYFFVVRINSSHHLLPTWSCPSPVSPYSNPLIKMGQVTSRLRNDRSREGSKTAVVGTGNPPAPAPLRREATQEEIDTLPHVADRVPFAAWAVVVAGAAERATYFGIISPWRELGNPLSFLLHSVVRPDG